MNNIQVVNLRNCKPEAGWLDIKCDRSTVLGNPFELEGEESRVMVVRAHKQWLNQARLHNRNEVLPLSSWTSQGFKVAKSYKRPTSFQVMQELNVIENAVRGGKKVRLQCWCNPRQCHCDNYKAYLVWKLSL